jgi:hypothetical protein
MPENTVNTYHDYFSCNLFSWPHYYYNSSDITAIVVNAISMSVSNINVIFLIGILGGGVQLGQLGTVATNRPIVPAAKIGGMIGRGKPKYYKKTFPNAALSTTNPTCCLDANPGRRGGKPASNPLNYGTVMYHDLGITWRNILVVCFGCGVFFSSWCYICIYSSTCCSC